MNYKYFTSESVASGHPDKICDRISDAILDACLTRDKFSHTGIECMATADHLILAGEVKSKARVDYAKVARKIIRQSGFSDPIFNFTDKSPIDVFIHQQSSDIAVGVDNGGAGDQGMMFGYATNETEELMPLPIILAHNLVKEMDMAREKKVLPYLRPDGKSMVNVRYENNMPKNVDSVILAVPHDPKISKEELKTELFAKIVKPVLSRYGYECLESDLIVNGTGRWEIGGPVSDTGLTGRKIIVDTYGGMGRTGGGCFSGKDPSKVDRSGAYATRFIAKNIVARKMAGRCEIQIAYVIGKKQPVVRAVETFGTENIDKKKIEKFAWEILDLSVGGIIKGLNLLRPIYLPTACYGHFGRKEFPWEKILA